MKKVNKYPLKWESKQTINLPIGAQIISCKSKDDETPAIYEYMVHFFVGVD